MSFIDFLTLSAPGAMNVQVEFFDLEPDFGKSQTAENGGESTEISFPVLMLVTVSWHCVPLKTKVSAKTNCPILIPQTIVNHNSVVKRFEKSAFKK